VRDEGEIHGHARIKASAKVHFDFELINAMPWSSNSPSLESLLKLSYIQILK